MKSLAGLSSAVRAYAVSLRGGKKRFFLAGAVLLGVLAVVTLYRGRSEPGIFRTAAVKRGDLLVTISATGTIEPEEVVDVGAQVAGLILSFGKDAAGKTIDYGSQVEEGTVLAQIDESLYQSDVAQADAQLRRAKADLLQAQAKLTQADRDWKRAQKLGPSDALSQSAYDSYRAAFESAQANVAVVEAQIVQAEAALVKAKRNLGYCIIKSPVKGVIIDRRVNIGQTVVSSLNAPSLFLIAKDLRRMQVWVSVNEADVGNIRPGQRVTFTVDAFPGEEFTGEVGKIRLNATMTQNVVTYIVEVNTDNSSGRLLPYLTANAKFEVSNRRNVLLVPNTALRWAPRVDQMADREGSGEHQERTPRGTAEGERGTVWVPEGDRVRPITVQVRGSDGVNTEVEGSGLSEQTVVVIGAEDRKRAERESGGTSNPFAPTFPRGARRV